MAKPREQPALWSPNATPDVVILEATDIANAIPLLLGVESLAEASTKAERHLVFAHSTARFRLCIRHCPNRGIPAVSTPCDSLFRLRLAASGRFDRYASGKGSVPNDVASPSTYRRSRLVQLLVIHDELSKGASTRDLAFGIIYPRHRPLVGATWKGSSERRHTLRLIATARRAVKSGCALLLAHR
jgi:hypothetical protein